MNGSLRLWALVGVLALTACTPAPSQSASPSTTAATATTTTPTTAMTSTPSSPATMIVTVYFSNTVLDPGTNDCAQVYGVHRTIPESDDVLTSTLKQLLAGPTAAETAQGYRSWFSSATSQALIGSKVAGNTSYVNLTDIRAIIPNASTSCGSAQLLAQLTTTAQQAAMTPRVLYAISGQPKTFWEWLQVGCDATNDNCDPTPFS